MIVLCDGVEIGYDDVGTGMPVAFIHGFPHNRTLWAPQVSALVDRSLLDLSVSRSRPIPSSKLSR